MARVNEYAPNRIRMAPISPSLDLALEQTYYPTSRVIQMPSGISSYF